MFNHTCYVVSGHTQGLLLTQRVRLRDHPRRHLLSEMGPCPNGGKEPVSQVPGSQLPALKIHAGGCCMVFQSRSRSPLGASFYASHVGRGNYSGKCRLENASSPSRCRGSVMHDAKNFNSFLSGEEISGAFFSFVLCEWCQGL